MNRYDGYMEMEYAIAAEYRNKGYATQAVKQMLDYGFKEMNLSVIAAWVRSHNWKSIQEDIRALPTVKDYNDKYESMRVLEKCSFTLEGKLRKHARDKNDTICYSILILGFHKIRLGVDKENPQMHQHQDHVWPQKYLPAGRAGAVPGLPGDFPIPSGAKGV